MPTWLIQILVGLVLTVAGQIVTSMARQDKASAQQRPSGVRTTLQSGGDLAPGFILGRYASGGQLRYAGTWGNEGETPNAYFSRAVEVSCLPIRGYSGWYVNGERVTLAGAATGTLGYAVLEYRDAAGKDHLWINPYLGDQTAPDPLMLATFGPDPDRPYSGMVGRGCGYFVVTALVNRELFAGVPEVLAEVDGIALDDPRGDAQHDNPIVAAYTLLKGLSYGGEWIYGPQGIGDVNFRAANLEQEADKCDAARALAGGGTEKRFRIGMDVALDEEPQAVVGELLKGCSGRWADLGGVYRFLVGAPGAAVVSISDGDILITEPQTLDPFPGLENLHNAMTATYPEPAEAWAMKEAPPRYSTTLEAEDDGRRLPFSTAFRAVPHAVQVQELMQSAIADARRFRRHSQTMPPEFWEYEPLDVAAWTSERNGYDAKDFLITVLDDLPNANQFAGLQEIDPADYGWSAADELPVVTSPLVIARPAPQVMTGWTAIPAFMEDPDGVGWLPSIEVGWAAGLVDVRAVLIIVREAWGGQRVIFDGEITYDIAELAPSRIINAAFLRKRGYEALGKYLPFSGRRTEFSEPIGVTTPDIAPVPPGSIDPATLVLELRNRIGAVLDQMMARQDEIEIALGDMAQVQMESEQMLLEAISGVSVRNAAAAARVVTVERVQITATEALASLTTTVDAHWQQSTAGGLFSVTAVAGEAEGSVRLLLAGRVNVNDTVEDVALQLEAISVDGVSSSEVLVMADRYRFLNTSNAIVSQTFAIGSDSGGDFVKVTNLRFETITSIDLETIVMDGITGFTSFGN